MKDTQKSAIIRWLKYLILYYFDLYSPWFPFSLVNSILDYLIVKCF